MAYVNNPYEPVCKMGENMLVWSGGKWLPFTVSYIEALPASSPLTVDFGAVASVGTIQAALPQSLRLDTGYLIEVWMKPIEDFEIVLWLLQGQGKFRIKNAQARVSHMTALQDPDYTSSRFYILGRDLDPYIEIRNPRSYALGATEVAFWGNKYLLSNATGRRADAMLSGDIAAARVVAESKVS